MIEDLSTEKLQRPSAVPMTVEWIGGQYYRSVGSGHHLFNDLDALSPCYGTTFAVEALQPTREQIEAALVAIRNVWRWYRVREIRRERSNGGAL